MQSLRRKSGCESNDFADEFHEESLGVEFCNSLTLPCEVLIVSPQESCSKTQRYLKSSAGHKIVSIQVKRLSDDCNLLVLDENHTNEYHADHAIIWTF